MSAVTSLKTLHIEGIGDVLLKRSRNTRYLRVKVDQKEGIILTLPEVISEKQAIRFLNEKKAWIQRSILRQQKVKNQSTIFTDGCNFKTRTHILYLARHSKNTIKSVVSGDKIIVWFPDYAQAEHPKVQKVIRRAVEEAWRIEAKQYLPVRVKQLASHFNLHYNKLTVKNAKTRWGSCSATNNINLNLQLMRLPDRLIDYIILHELMHTVHKNHQKSFWSAMERALPGARTIDKELNRYHLEYW
jgi:predicted metal-dependent hydrolase